MLVLAGLLTFLSAPAHANGQSSHIWISLHALEHLPDGDLRDLLTREDLRPMLVNGTMFPDGGYAVGDNYGEMAHWSLLQGSYLDWIRASHDAPWTDEASEHIAFLMGMASHGMADETYDALFMERAKVYDAEGDWANVSFDEATDVVTVAMVGPQDYTEVWVPSEELSSIYASTRGYDIDPEVLVDAQSLLQLAVAWVGAVAENPESVAAYEAEYPWASANMLELDVPGSPPCEGRVVARYWEVIWERLEGSFLMSDAPVIATFPRDGSYEHPLDSETVEARVSLVFSRGLEDDVLSPALFEVVDEAGEGHPIAEAYAFYRDESHVVHLVPETDWAADMAYTVTVLPGVMTIGGEVWEQSWSFGFSTGEAPVEEAVVEESVEDAGGCSVGGGAVGWLWIAGLIGLSRRRS